MTGGNKNNLPQISTFSISIKPLKNASFFRPADFQESGEKAQ